MTEVTVKLVLRKNTLLSVLSGKVYCLFQSYQKFKKKDTKTI